MWEFTVIRVVQTLLEACHLSIYTPKVNKTFKENSHVKNIVMAVGV